MKIARIVSYILHPLFMPLIGVFIIFNADIYGIDIPSQFRRFVYLITLLCDIMIPLSFIPVFIYLKQIQNITMESRKERLIPLFVTSVSLFFGYFLVTKISPIKVINTFLLASCIVVILIFIISVFWKISIHMAGIGGLTGLIAILSISYKMDLFIILSIVLLLSGIIASARLAMNTHSPMQLLTGYGLGLFTVMGLLF